MPMPPTHQRQLESIREALEALEEVSRSPRLRTVLDEFHDDPEARREASRNATEYFRRHGVEVPHRVTIELRDNNWRVSICVKLRVLEVDIEYGYHYDSREGFGWGC